MYIDFKDGGSTKEESKAYKIPMISSVSCSLHQKKQTHP